MGKKHHSDDAKSDFKRNKEIPKEYETAILKALSHYPELINTNIIFKKKKYHPVPYGTTPLMSSLLIPGVSRKYIISIREHAPAPMHHALFKNLPLEAQIGAIAHELGHVLQYESLKTPTLIAKNLFNTKPLALREIERNADVKAIEHGLGHELHMHSVYIRNIDGYLEARPELNINYLKPKEIVQGIMQKKTGMGV